MSGRAAQAILRRISWSWWVLLEFARRDESLRQSELSERLGVAADTVGQHLRALREVGFLEWVPRRGEPGNAERCPGEVGVNERSRRGGSRHCM